MSFLNALASDGLSVGLRFYNAKINSEAKAKEARPAVAQDADEARAGSGCSSQASSLRCPAKKVAAKASPQQLAAGRAEAKARLSSDGSLGQLMATGLGDDNVAPVQDRALTFLEKQQLADLQDREDQIKAQVQVSVSHGVPGAGSVEYEYAVGPDGQRYVSGLKESLAGDESLAALQTGPVSAENLDQEEQKQIQELKRRDQEVRAHEQAHVTAAAGLAGAPVYEYQTGPDGKRYAVGGHVDLKTSGASDPETALREAEIIKRAATAPAEPSATDRSVASKAEAKINKVKSQKFSGSDIDSGDELLQSPRLAYNGDGFERQALGAYTVAKATQFSFFNRPVLATA